MISRSVSDGWGLGFGSLCHDDRGPSLAVSALVGRIDGFLVTALGAGKLVVAAPEVAGPLHLVLATESPEANLELRVGLARLVRAVVGPRDEETLTVVVDVERAALGPAVDLGVPMPDERWTSLHERGPSQVILIDLGHGLGKEMTPVVLLQHLDEAKRVGVGWLGAVGLVVHGFVPSGSPSVVGVKPSVGLEQVKPKSPTV